MMRRRMEGEWKANGKRMESEWKVDGRQMEGKWKGKWKEGTNT